MDLKIKDVAELLSISETTIRRWVTEGKIPVYRLHHQYRFSRIEIEDWVMSCKLGKEVKVSDSPLKEQVIYKSTLSKKRGMQQFSLYRAVHKGEVLASIQGKTKEDYIRSSVQIIAKNFAVDLDVIADLLLDRESPTSTAISHGIAIPHTRDFLLKGTEDIVSIVYPKKPLDWGALDGKDVHTLFFLFACDEKRHLHLLSKIAHLAHNTEALDFLQKKPSKHEVLSFIKQWESSL